MTMALWWPFRLLVVAVGFLAAAAALAAAPTQIVAPGTALQPVLDAASSGDVIRLQAGEHAGPVVIRLPLVLEGEQGAAVIGSGEGSVVRVEAPDVTVRGLTIRGSGDKLDRMDSGIFLDKKAHRALVEGNHLDGNLFGVYVWGPEEAIVRSNTIRGRRVHITSETGSGVRIWNSPGSRILDNDIEFGADGIYVHASSRNVFRGNTMRNVRFAVHYMYTNDSEVSGNRSFDSDVGYAIMFSHRLEVRDNISDGDRDHGFMFNYANYSRAEGNIVRNGGEKCVFIYNANFNELRRNWFEGCELGIHFTAGSEGNTVSGNAFIRNRSQVKYVATRFVDWSKDGQGNYWSDNAAFDLDGDGIADQPYRPNDVIDQVLWRNPMAMVLVTSPAVQTIRWAQSQLPALQPGGVVDSAPLMHPPKVSGDG